MTDSSQVQFIENQIPTLGAGDYTITVKQKVTPDMVKQPESSEEFVHTQKFSILGPRFTLDPNEIRAVFPPPGNLGEHSNALPHLILERSTLPWERSANGDTNMPWLALLLFDEEDLQTKDLVDQIKTPQSLKLSDLNITLESGDHPDDAVTVIDVPKELLVQIMPSKEELQLLAHVRQTANTQGKLDEVSVIICNRLPKSGSMSIIHLVSVEGRYKNAGFDFQDVNGGGLVRLVSLYSWRFACVSDDHSFKGLLSHLKPGTLRLPDIADKTANEYFSMGCVPLHHEMRQGNKSVSWYHGPLITFRNTKEFCLPVRSGDELVLYNPGIGMFDVSYSAAWELGRLLTLQNKRVSVDLFNWKRSHAHGQPTGLDLPNDVRNWLESLALLRELPFNYLVPDERLLPTEAIRFFQVDPGWVECLLDGAFSIGRVLTADYDFDSQFEKDGHWSPPGQLMSGFLLRSDVVSGWPGLLVDGHGGKDASKLILKRMDRLSKNVLICLFSGECAIQAVDVYQRPETLHFALDDQKLNVKKPDEKRVVDIYDLAQKIDAKNSAELAMQMIKSAENIRLKLA